MGTSFIHPMPVPCPTKTEGECPLELGEVGGGGTSGGAEDTGISYQADFPYSGKATLGLGESDIKLMCVSSFLGSL